jgi:hypothetical protein
MYKKRSASVSTVNELRCTMLMEKCGGTFQKFDPNKNVDLSPLPPPRCAYKNTSSESIIRLQFGNIQNPEILCPTDDNGWIMVGENIEPKWYEGDILPPKTG